jgi:thiamine pyrophosphate-dependent acetolactate synthase large subunit-like protein
MSLGAFHLAQSGRMGPVVLALPEDILSSIGPYRFVPKAHKVQPGLDLDAICSGPSNISRMLEDQSFSFGA